MQLAVFMFMFVVANCRADMWSCTCMSKKNALSVSVISVNVRGVWCQWREREMREERRERDTHTTSE